jgi:hypothetical protein
MGNLTEFKDLVNDITDPELLNVAEGLLRDMVEMENMRERIEMLEDGLSKGDRAAFWFFAMGLDMEQIDLATNTVIGRRRYILDQESRKKAIEDANDAEAKRIEEGSTDESSVIEKTLE